MMWGLAAGLALTEPVWAQYAAPLGGGYGSPSFYSAPEAAAGAIGGGAANSAASQTQCASSIGRDRGHTGCASDPATEARPRR